METIKPDMDMTLLRSISGTSIHVLSAAKGLAVLWMLCALPVFPCRGADDSNGHPPVQVTNLEALSRAVDATQSRTLSIHIEGTVWWSSEVEGRVILHDDTTVTQLELNLPCQMPHRGERLILQGDCSAVRTRDVIKLSCVPVVGNDGLHAMLGKTGRIHLKAGRHPIRVDWFNRTDQYGLQIEYEGPGIPRQRVTDSVLFRSEGAVNGLNYRSCEGQWWSLLPNLDHIKAVKTGTAANFDIGVRSRDNHVALQFLGFIEIPEEGEYTFHVQSDDGSRLLIGPSSFQVRASGGATHVSPAMGIEDKPAGDAVFQWSEIEGVVTSVHRPQGTLEMEVMTESGRVRVKVAQDSDTSYTLRPQNRIRAHGVSRRILNLAGRRVQGEFYVQSWEDVEQEYITPTIWAEYPIVEVSSLTAETPGGSRAVVHLNGRITSAGDGAPMELEDESGRIVLADTAPDHPVSRVSEVLGFVDMEGSNRVLRCTHFRRFGGVDTEAEALPVFTTIEQIYQLSLEDAARNYPVKVRGVITSPLEADAAVLQDSSRGIYVNIGRPFPLETGDYCEIEGVTNPYEFTPYIQVSKLRKLGAGSLPDAVRPTWDQLINGSLHCNYVELEGVVASVTGDTVTLLTRDGRINVRLNAIGPGLPRDVLGATVCLRGCLFADWDGDTRRVVVGSIYLDQHLVSVVHEAPVNPFAIPLKRVGELLQFDPQAGALQRVKVSGMLVYQDAKMCCLMDGENGLRFVPLEAASGHVGDRVEVVGFLDLSGPSPLLQEAVVRRLGQDELPEPRKLRSADLVRDEFDSTLVQVEGILISGKGTPDGYVLDLQNGIRRFTATVKGRDGLDAGWTPGSRLELTGVYIGQGGNRVLGHPIDSFRLLLNSGADVKVLSLPPWWTLKRMLIVLGMLAGILAGALVWINLLHRKVEDRTRQLGDQTRKHEMEQERTRVAQDLHDDLGAGLTEVNMLASLAQSPATTAEEKDGYIDELNELALHMVDSLDEIVWAINPRNDTMASLADYFGSYAQRLLELASISCGLDIAEDLPDHALDPRFRQGLFLTFKEALSNVIQHASATKVWVRISIQDDEIVVIVSDDGCGILSDTHEAGADGLANMQERLSGLSGHCDIRSDPGKGTSVRLQAPIQKELI